MATPDDDPRVEALLREAPSRDAQPLTRRDRVAETGIALILLAAVAAMAAWLPGRESSSVVLAGLLLIVATLANRVRFTVGSCVTVPTQIALLPMLLLLDPAMVPLLAVASQVLSRLPDYLHRRVHPDHAVLTFGDAMFTVAPAVVLALAAPGAPSFAEWPVYLAALAALSASDAVATAVRLWLAHGVPPKLQASLSTTGITIDWALAALAFPIALAAYGHPEAVVLGVPLLGLLNALGREREQRIQHTLQLSAAYRGSALLMGEMLEADDPYTGGEHSQGVVVLALAVGRELLLDPREQRHLEFGALLHDIGKLRVPDDILNKPGKLTAEEWEVMKLHPVDGQAMLDRIGGMLAEVGLTVRAHHERWDGKGYPDGLVGDEIPLPARIICVCDAYSAMTTNRSYRAAMPEADALAELRACAGSQFDPRVVNAVERVVARETPQRLSTRLVA
jgi:HD-GYP domain-containing protein (c-di-GMP phosphodiesterase class II)